MRRTGAHQGVEVGRRTDFLQPARRRVGNLLGGHEARRANHGAVEGFAAVVAQPLGKPEVGDFRREEFRRLLLGR